MTLCEQEAPAEEIEIALNELDVVASQLLGAVDPIDRRSVQSAARAALEKDFELADLIRSGPDANTLGIWFASIRVRRANVLGGGSMT